MCFFPSPELDERTERVFPLFFFLALKRYSMSKSTQKGSLMGTRKVEEDTHACVLGIHMFIPSYNVLSL